MSQEDFYQLLLKNKGKKLSTKEIAKHINVLPKSVNHSGKNLIKTNMVKSEISGIGIKERFYWI